MIGDIPQISRLRHTASPRPVTVSAAVVHQFLTRRPGSPGAEALHVRPHSTPARDGRIDYRASRWCRPGHAHVGRSSRFDWQKCPTAQAGALPQTLPGPSCQTTKKQPRRHALNAGRARSPPRIPFGSRIAAPDVVNSALPESTTRRPEATAKVRYQTARTAARNPALSPGAWGLRPPFSRLGHRLIQADTIKGQQKQCSLISACGHRREVEWGQLIKSSDAHKRGSPVGAPSGADSN